MRHIRLFSLFMGFLHNSKNSFLFQSQFVHFFDTFMKHSYVIFSTFYSFYNVVWDIPKHETLDPLNLGRFYLITSFHQPESLVITSSGSTLSLLRIEPFIYNIIPILPAYLYKILIQPLSKTLISHKTYVKIAIIQSFHPINVI